MAIVIATLFVVVQRCDADVLASDIGVTAFNNGVVVVQIPYRRDGGPGQMTVLVDGRTIASEAPAYAMKYGSDNYYFRTSEELRDRVLVRVSFESDAVAQRIRKEVRVVWVPAQEIPFADESAPRAAADAVIALAKAHHADENLPAYASTVIDELKREMRWSVSDGVTPERYMSGINVWARQKSLPIHAELISSTYAAMLDASSDALDAGGTVQARLLFKRDGRTVGERTVGIERVVRDGNSSYVAVRDSVGPIGTNVYRVRNGVVTEYGFSDDVAVLGWIFVQYWTK